MLRCELEAIWCNTTPNTTERNGNGKSVRDFHASGSCYGPSPPVLCDELPKTVSANFSLMLRDIERSVRP